VLVVPSAGPGSDPLTRFLSHIQFASPESTTALDRWWDQVLARR
jgi:hypothetical protein